jgi:hypothetical protein
MHLAVVSPTKSQRIYSQTSLTGINLDRAYGRETGGSRSDLVPFEPLA